MYKRQRKRNINRKTYLGRSRKNDDQRGKKLKGKRQREEGVPKGKSWRNEMEGEREEEG